MQTNVEVKMMAKDRRADAEFCHNSSMKFSDKINGANSTSTEVTSSTLPVEASFASAAAAAPLIVEEGPSGAPGLMASSLAVLAAALLAAVCF